MNISKHELLKRFGLVGIGLFAAMTLVAAPADDWRGYDLVGHTDKEALSYRSGEEMVFTLKLIGEKDSLPEGDWRIRWSRTGDDGAGETNTIPAELGRPLAIRTKLDRPGFVQVLAEVVDAHGRLARKRQGGDNRVFFDGGAAVEPRKLRGLEEPKDFDAYWKRQMEALAAVPVEAERKQVGEDDKVTVYAVRVKCAGPRPLTGYLTVPKGAKGGRRYPAEVVYMCYGEYVPRAPRSGSTEMVQLITNAHGLELEQPASYYAAFWPTIRGRSGRYAFNPDENAKPDTCYFRGMALRAARALEYMKTLPEWDGVHLRTQGGSQGGLQAIWGAALVPGVTHAEPVIPWMCDIGGYTEGRLRAIWPMEYLPGLAYYDAAFHGKRIPECCSVKIRRANLGDYISPPSGIAILYNGIRGPKTVKWCQGCTHTAGTRSDHMDEIVWNDGYTEGK